MRPVPLHGFQIGGCLFQIGFDLGDLIHGRLCLFVFALTFQCADLLEMLLREACNSSVFT